MFAEFFIKRPIFASVCSILIVLLGGISIPSLPVAQYPSITPPQVSVQSTYVGASAQTVESSVTTILEQAINGVEGMKYMTSTSGNDGVSNITVTFDLSRNIDNAAVDVQNRVSSNLGRLPNEVKNTGVTVNKVSNSIVLGVGLSSDRNDSLFVSNYADLFIKDALKRVKGVGDVTIFGQRKYAMRLWLDPTRLAERKITAPDVVEALAEQNVQVPAGQIGQPPFPDGQSFQTSVRVHGRLRDPKEFGELIVKTGVDGTTVRMKDVARIELGAEDYGSFLRFNGTEAIGLGVYQLPNANALDVAKGCRAELERLSKRFPPGLKYFVAFDTTLSVEQSIHEVLVTLAQAILLVILVIFIFLQDWRSTLIPAITIPVSLIGTFAVMKMLGFSINTLTLFGITLATGLVVDDAIVVIENIARQMKTHRLDAKTAASQGMAEVTGAVVATSLVLGAVFVPVAFFPGTTGQLYRQFALTIAISVGLSAFNSLTLTPALSALLLKQEGHPGGLFALFNWFIERVTYAYTLLLRGLVKVRYLVLLLFIGLIGLTVWIYNTVPSAFIPNEDQGYFITTVQGPAGVSLGYTTNVIKKIEKVLMKYPEIIGVFSVGGFGFTGNGANNGVVFATLAPYNQRKGADHTLDAVINRVRAPLMSLTDATVIPFNPPAINGLGNFGGFQFEVMDTSGGDISLLERGTREICSHANQTPGLTGIFSSFKANDPQIIVDVDRAKSKLLGIPLSDVFSTLQVFVGSLYVNDFDFLNRAYRVYLQADRQFRSHPEDINRLYVRSVAGALVPLHNLVRVSHETSPQTISHYNLFRSTEVDGSAAPGTSSGQAIALMEGVADKVLPQGLGYEWTGISLEQIQSSSQTFLIFGLGVVFVFLVLAAQYESFVDPFIILLSVPLAILGALAAQRFRGLENDIFCQIGLVMLIGLASKNAILIVEFANHLRKDGRSLVDSVVEAARLRLRPILMTSLAFISGIAPLIVAEGAGANSRHSLGTAVLGGMLFATSLNLLIVPVLYVIINATRNFFSGKKDVRKDTDARPTDPSIKAAALLDDYLPPPVR
jgi:hydrophobic/amphiphilic exporter-1 (mainly G- bacteria), HAE1 family